MTELLAQDVTWTETLTHWTTLYAAAVPVALFPLLISLGYALQYAPEIGEQFYDYASRRENAGDIEWSLWPALNGSRAAKHTLDLFDDPIPYAMGLFGGLDLPLMLGISMMGTQLIQWYGVNEGVGRPTFDTAEGSTYDVLGVDVPKVYAGYRVWVFAGGAVLTAARIALLALP